MPIGPKDQSEEGEPVGPKGRIEAGELGVPKECGGGRMVGMTGIEPVTPRV